MNLRSKGYSPLPLIITLHLHYWFPLFISFLALQAFLHLLHYLFLFLIFQNYQILNIKFFIKTLVYYYMASMLFVYLFRCKKGLDYHTCYFQLIFHLKDYNLMLCQYILLKAHLQILQEDNEEIIVIVICFENIIQH